MLNKTMIKGALFTLVVLAAAYRVPAAKKIITGA